MLRGKDVVGLLIHLYTRGSLYLGPKSPGVPKLCKLATMGSTNSWQVVPPQEGVFVCTLQNVHVPSRILQLSFWE